MHSWKKSLRSTTLAALLAFSSTTVALAAPNVTLNVHDGEVRDVLTAISALSDASIVTDESVKGKITIALDNVPFNTAIKLITSAKGLAYLAVNEDGTYKSSFAKFFEEEQLKELVKAMDGEPGDLLLFAADKKKVVWDVLGALRLHLAKSLDLLKKDDFRFLWVTEFPLLEWSEEQNRFVAMHHPFTMPMEEDLQYIDSDPGRVRAKAYDIVLNLSLIHI